MIRIGSNRLLGFILLAFGGVIAMFASGIEEGFGSGALSSGFFPQFLCGVLIVIGLALLVQKETDQTARLMPGWRAGGFAAALLIFTLTFPLGDFRIWTFVFMLATMPMLGERRIPRVILVAAVVALGVHALFRYGFNTILPFWF
ncbi:MAG: tripartite tricarboxylate transporter TctB family protein [Spiribacter salinus]|uniref:Tripartite tricarboxylate transporter TctB family protein n=1 Tax=Spiribacter salinus TaxID=1335746 RepID=A0A540VSX3_9GAMM|nr:MAG: tripartite tricarboxylate transporter TctB family protein [Spiribacter salinus]